MKELNFDKLEKMNFYGTDASIEISLMEYGLLCRTWEKSEDTFQFIYVIDWLEYEVPLRFDICVLSTDEVNEAFYDLDPEGVLSFVGISESEWMDLPIQHKVSDLISYFGYEDVFGSSYSTFDTEELNQWIENN